ncbi:MORN repeat-containing protein 4, partial [Trachymyrmex zeteki]
STGVAKNGAYKYDDGTKYIGDWNRRGLKHGAGLLVLSDGTRYDGGFQNGLCSGLGVIVFSDGAKYEGEFMQGWFHGHGVFWRADGMKFEGEFRGGRVWGLGLVTYADGSHGFPRNEGFFQDCRLLFVIVCVLAVANAGYIGLPSALQYHIEPIAHVQPAITSTSDNILRSHGNLAQVATQTKTIDTPFSSSSKADIRVTNPAVTTYAHFAHPAPLTYAAAAVPAAGGGGGAYSPAVEVSHMSYSSPIGIAYAY